MRSADNERVSGPVKRLYSLLDLFRGGYAFNKSVAIWNNLVRLRSVKGYVNSLRGKISAAPSGSSSSNILFATSTGRDALPMMVETALSASCALEGGSKIYMSYCVGAPICNLCNYKVLGDRAVLSIADSAAENPFCSSCRSCIPKHLQNADWLQLLELSGDSLDKEVSTILNSFENNKLSAFEFDYEVIANEVDIPAFGILQHATASTLKFFAVDCLDSGESKHISIFGKYLSAAISYAVSLKKLIDEYEIDVVVVNHGIYCPQGVFVEMANYLGKRVVCWNLAYRRNSFIFAHEVSYHYDMVDERFDPEMIEWSTEKELQIKEYLNQRRTGETDWLTFQRQVALDKRGEIDRYLTFTHNFKKLVGVLTNVAWDAQVHFKDNVYVTMRDWLHDMVQFAIGEPEVGVIVRIHPAETRGLLPSNVRVKDMLRQSGLPQPANLLILDPESIITSYKVADDSHAVVVYGSKMSVELAPFVPVVVCGEGWVRNKGIAFELNNRGDLCDVILTALDSKIDEVTYLKALKYAYYVFFQRFIEVDGLKQLSSHYPPFELPKGECVSALMNSPGIQTITKGILEAKPFTLIQRN